MMKMNDNVSVNITATEALNRIKDFEDQIGLIKELEDLRECRLAYDKFINQLWEIIGTAGYTGGSLIEHIKELREYKRINEQRLKELDSTGFMPFEYVAQKFGIKGEAND